MTLVLWALVALISLYWLAQVVASVLLVRGVPRLSSVPLPEGRTAWPKLSMIVPACNEVATLEAALRSKLAEGYPNVEVVLIDDRSTDGTSELVDRLAVLDPRVQPVHITELPPGWLGKVHALQRGLERASGEWILFTDADIHFTPGALRRAIVHCEARGCEHLSAMPTFWTRGLLMTAIIATFGRMMMLAGRPWKASDPRSKAGGGAGAFNLFTRAALDRTPGLEWLRLETADDVTLGLMLKRHGARSVFANGCGQLALDFFANLRELGRSIEKASTIFHFRSAPPIAFAVVSSTLELGPIALAVFGSGPVRLAGLAGVAMMIAVSTVVARFFELPTIGILLAPVGSVVFFVLTAVVGVRVARQRGLSWRGTRYPADQLLAGRRFGTF